MPLPMEANRALRPSRSHDCERGDQPCRAHGVDQSAAGHLPGQRNKSSRGQDQADIELRPLMRSQIDSNERTKTGLNVGEKKGEPVEAANAPRRRRRLCCRHRVLRWRRRRNSAVGAAVEPTAVQFQR
jgi:hypothetical protein